MGSEMCIRDRVKKEHLAARLSRQLGNASSHGTASDDGYALKLRLHMKVLFAQAVLQAMTKCSYEGTKGL